MRIVCVGGGPAGLYFAILTKLADPDHEVTVLERNPAGVTYGWGVVFWDDLLDDLFRCDPVSAQDIWNSAAKWDEYEVRAGGKPTTFFGGYGFSLGRRRLLSILAARATNLGVDLRTLDDVEDLSRFDDADLIVACDGANSRVRQLHADAFGTNVDVARNKYIWLGTHTVFDTFTFGFEETEAGWIWFHAYPFNAETSTFIVECTPETWSALGFDELSSDDSMAVLEKIFARHLNGNSLINQLHHLGRTPWLNFRRVTNERWHHSRVVLMGDAAHTTHFAIGSGTKLAMQDATALAARLTPGADLEAALDAYERQRRADIAPLQRAALRSSRWFEDLDRYVDQDAMRFAYSLFNRRGEYPLWRYRLHVATQRESLRQLQRRLLSVRRWARARRRSTDLKKSGGVAVPEVGVCGGEDGLEPLD
jgi:2-polyprenyl-6-methoxyphenol hydroxylase-like FAD-dependent oxidoreductase